MTSLRQLWTCGVVGSSVEVARARKEQKYTRSRGQTRLLFDYLDRLDHRITKKCLSYLSEQTKLGQSMIVTAKKIRLAGDVGKRRYANFRLSVMFVKCQFVSVWILIHVQADTGEFKTSESIVGRSSNSKVIGFWSSVLNKNFLSSFLRKKRDKKATFQQVGTM